MPSVFIKTYGCQMNERDSEAVSAQLVARGYSLAPSEALADVVLLNTCSVRDAAEQKAVRKMQNLAADVRRHRPEVVLGFLGCMAQSRGQELIDKLPDVDLVLGTQKFHRTADYLDEIFSGQRGKIVDVAAEQGSEGTIKEHLQFPANGQDSNGKKVPVKMYRIKSLGLCGMDYQDVDMVAVDLSASKKEMPEFPDMFLGANLMVGNLWSFDFENKRWYLQ